MQLTSHAPSPHHPLHNNSSLRVLSCSLLPVSNGDKREQTLMRRTFEFSSVCDACVAHQHATWELFQTRPRARFDRDRVGYGRSVSRRTISRIRISCCFGNSLSSLLIRHETVFDECLGRCQNRSLETKNSVSTNPLTPCSAARTELCHDGPDFWGRRLGDTSLLLPSHLPLALKTALLPCPAMFQLLHVWFFLREVSHRNNREPVLFHQVRPPNYEEEGRVQGPDVKQGRIDERRVISLLSGVRPLSTWLARQVFP